MVSGLLTLYPPSGMCMHSEPAGSHLQAKYCLWYQFCCVSPNTCSRRGGVNSAWAIPGAGRVSGTPGSHRAETQILLPLLARKHNQKSESAPLWCTVIRELTPPGRAMRVLGLRKGNFKVPLLLSACFHTCVLSALSKEEELAQNSVFCFGLFVSSLLELRSSYVVWFSILPAWLSIL